MQGQLLSPLPLAFQACGYVLKELPGAGEDGGPGNLDPCLCSPLPQGGFGTWAEAMVPFGHADG